MKKKKSRTEAIKEIEEFFGDILSKKPEQIRKIKKMAMAHNIKLGNRRKLFCKECFMPYKDPSIRIKNDMITIKCGNCGGKSKWKII
ncbi:MAG: hypothetical protein KKB31_03025 [Nanoarchaeota archaeon]|nr:hypothetical protein [Nanoarchaeota archaeon]